MIRKEKGYRVCILGKLGQRGKGRVGASGKPPQPRRRESRFDIWPRNEGMPPEIECVRPYKALKINMSQ
jgi:hypothetical protein